jgi:hypothetical protein
MIKRLLLTVMLSIPASHATATEKQRFNCEAYNEILKKADTQIRLSYSAMLKDIDKINNEDYIDGHESDWAAKKRAEIAASAASLQGLMRTLRPDRPVFPNEFSGYLLGRYRGCASGAWLVFYDRSEAYISTIFDNVGRYAAGKI